MCGGPRIARLVAVIILMTWREAALSGTIGIAPLRVDFDHETRSAVMQIFNTGEESLAMQVEPLRWTQSAEGEDQYETASEVVAVPPVFQLAPGETQLVRVGLLSERPHALREQTYRLFFTELPAPVEPGTRAGLRMRLRVSVPVFSAALAEPQPELQLLGVALHNDRLQIRLQNSGNSHLRVAELQLLSGSGGQWRNANARYILAGGTRNFYFDDLPTDANFSRLRAVTDDGGVREYEVAVPH